MGETPFRTLPKAYFLEGRPNFILLVVNLHDLLGWLQPNLVVLAMSMGRAFLTFLALVVNLLLEYTVFHLSLQQSGFNS